MSDAQETSVFKPDQDPMQSPTRAEPDIPKIVPVALTHITPVHDWPRILLVHGTMDRSTSFKRVAGHLRDYEVISYDRRGYANSPFRDRDGTPRKVSWQIHLQDLTEIISERPTVVFGHSYGGTLSLLAAERHADNLIGIITFESPLSWIPGWSRWSHTSIDPSEDIDLEWSQQEAKRFMISMIGEPSWKRLP
ncbi:MAG: alpha/beta fold hydrolase, partial [Actinomycetota bacterium]